MTTYTRPGDPVTAEVWDSLRAWLAEEDRGEAAYEFGGVGEDDMTDTFMSLVLWVTKMLKEKR